MSTIILRIAMTLALTGLTLSVTTNAQKNAPDREQFMAELKPYQHEFLIKELKLSKEQARTFFPVYDEMNSKLEESGNIVRQLERNTLVSEQASDDELLQAAQTVFEQKQKEGAIETEYFIKFKEILTPRQLLQLKSAERRFNQNLLRHHRRKYRDRNESELSEAQ